MLLPLGENPTSQRSVLFETTLRQPKSPRWKSNWRTARNTTRNAFRTSKKSVRNKHEQWEEAVRPSERLLQQVAEQTPQQPASKARIRSDTREFAQSSQTPLPVQIPHYSEQDLHTWMYNTHTDLRDGLEVEAESLWPRGLLVFLSWRVSRR